MAARALLALIAVAATLTGSLAPRAAAADTASPASAAAPTGLWTAPLSSGIRVTRGFDPPASDYGAGHRGVDLAGGVGQQVLAAGAGIVLFAGWIAGRPVISVRHAGGLRTTYEPVEPSLAAGQAVARGSPIGTLDAGHAGCPAAACLHWGLRRGDAYLDPLTLLRPMRVRLLPLPAHSA